MSHEYVNEVLKVAASDEPSWWDKQKAINRALRGTDKGLGKILAKDEVIGGRLHSGLKGLLQGGAVGAPAGAGLGALVGKSGGRGKAALLGALLGASLGGLSGQVHGQYKHDKDYLKKRGINLKYLGLSSDLTPKAKKKYIDAYKNK